MINSLNSKEYLTDFLFYVFGLLEKSVGLECFAKDRQTDFLTKISFR